MIIKGRMKYNCKTMFKSLGFSLLFIFTVISSPSFAEGMFGYDEVRFFEGEKVASDTTLQVKEGEPTPKENIWTEPIVGPDGRLYYYTPPKKVLNFVSNPTEENAKEYLKWNQERMSAYSKAQEVLKEVAKEEGIIKTTKSPNLSAKKVSKAPSQVSRSLIKPKVLYFVRAGCKYCTAEDLVIDQFIKKYKGEFDVEGVFVGEGNPPRLSFSFRKPKREEILGYKITEYPTTIFLMPSGKSFGIKGFASGKALEKIYWENKE